MVIRAAFVLGAFGACAPELDDATSLVTGPRLLATQLEPAEVAPGGSVTGTALWVDETGARADAPLDWAFCSARKPFSEPGPVAAACLAAEGDVLLPIGVGTTATGVVPETACRDFGPDAPDPVPGEPAGRPVDPDATGGFYQPLRVRVAEPDETYVLASARVRCGLPGATPAQAAEFRASYVANTNPVIAEVSADGATLVAAETDPTATARVSRDRTVTLSVRWATCDAPPCTGSEPFLWFDPERRVLVDRREGMRVSWFATAGAFATGRTGRAEDDAATPTTENTWTAPSAAGEAVVWTVLRDDRGGVTWRTFRLFVE